MHPLDRQLEAGLRGDFDLGWEIAQQLAEETPDDPRAAFNRGWYEMWRGNLLDGQRLMDSGRWINVFGNRHCNNPAPIWDGRSDGRVMLVLEGGLGDQIHGMRYIREMNPAVVACSRQLFGLVPGPQYVTNEAAHGIDCDYWVPSMSASSILGWEYEDVDGSPYIERTAQPIAGRVGLRWQGNPKFEHEQHRLFPSELMFNAVQGQNCVSLQRDEGSEHCPDWVTEVDLSSWEKTRRAISQCERVVTSCTSVAHMSAAMGVETWIVVPILPYYLWAKPGKSTVWYDNVSLYRQQKYGDWAHPFNEIAKQSNIREAA
jgi:hypothetical protein